MSNHAIFKQQLKETKTMADTAQTHGPTLSTPKPLQSLRGPFQKKRGQNWLLVPKPKSITSVVFKFPFLADWLFTSNRLVTSLRQRQVCENLIYKKVIFRSKKQYRQ